jgi:hypothetical protein
MKNVAINSDLTTNIYDPRNAKYLRPLSIAADAEMAELMANEAYGATEDKHGNDRNFNPDEAYRQCLVDARRMLRDREYWELFAPDEYFTPPLN